MKVNDQFFDAGAALNDEASVKYIQRKFGAHTAADFFDLDDKDASLKTFVHHWQAQGLTDRMLLDHMIQRVLDGRLHPLQSLRISRLLNDPSGDLEPEDKEVLIAQVLELEWPQAIPGGTA